jgi:hypothetical protein
MVCTRFIWFVIGTNGGLLWTRKWTFEWHEILGNSWVAARLAASQEGFSSMQLLSWLNCHMFGVYIPCFFNSEIQFSKYFSFLFITNFSFLILLPHIRTDFVFDVEILYVCFSDIVYLCSVLKSVMVMKSYLLFWEKDKHWRYQEKRRFDENLNSYNNRINALYHGSTS